MTGQDAPNYHELNNGDQGSCEGCLHGQFGLCTLHNFKCAPGHTCDSQEVAHPLPLSSFKVVDLDPPHGFLVWRGKQTAIASPHPLQAGQVMITSGDEAFGLATFSQPAQMTLAEFEREEQSDRHRIRPEERKMLWPKVEALYLCGIKEWNGFNQPQPIINGHVTLYEPSPEEAALIEKSKRLPKVITLEPEAVSLTDGGFVALEGVRGKELSEALKAIYGRFRFLEARGDKALPLYDLALVRQPALRFEKILSRVLSAEKAHNGVMVAFMLPAAAAASLALPQDSLPEGATALPPEELHLTLSYLGKKNELIGRELIEQVLSVLVSEYPPLTGKIGGIGRFSNIESDGTQAFYASFDSQDLPAFRQELARRLSDIGINSPSEHGFTPHLTLAYIPQGVEIPNVTLPDIEMSFRDLTLAWGDDHVVYPLTGQVKKKSAKEAEVMPIEETTGAAEVESGEKEESLQARVDRIRNGFQSRFCDNSGDWYNNPWVVDVFENYVIADWQGEKYQVSFTETQQGEFVFAPRLDWVVVTVSYVPVQAGAMKAVTKTENGSEFSRSAYLVIGDPDQVSTWKLRIEAEPGKVTKAQLGAAAAALSSGGFRGQQVDLSAEEKQAAARKLIAEYRKLEVADNEIPDHLWSTANMTLRQAQEPPSEKAGRRLAGGWMERLRAAKDALQELFTWAEYADESEPEMEPLMVPDLLKGDSGVAVKMVNGEPWHCSWSSNAFEDRDGEIFSLKSLEQYVQDNEENEVKGWFNLWHIKGTDFAEKRYQAIIGKFLFEAGPYLKDFKGQRALEFFKEHPIGHPELAPEGWGSSVEYRYLPEERKSKIYEWTWITRTSTLARGAAANIWTKATQENFIMTDEQKTAALVLFGKEFTEQLVTQGQQQTKKLEEAGVASKEKTELAPVAEAGQPMQPVASEAPAAAEAQLAAKSPAASTEELSQGAGDPAPASDPNQVIQTLAKELLADFGKALAPVITELQQYMVTLNSQVTTLGNEIKELKGEQALKQQVELPRFTFGLIQASKAKETVVPEGDALKDQKPEEAKAPVKEGSVAAAFFPAAK